MPKWLVLLLPLQQCGVSAGSRYLPVSNFLASALSHKYADDVVLGNSCCKFSDQKGLDVDLCGLAT